jgi:hypothetical protein
MVPGAPAHFVFNMDEIGHQSWAKAPETFCFVHSEFTESTVHVPVSRIGKRITLIACIAADGSFLCPCLIILRKIVEDELFLHGFPREKVEIYSQSKSCIVMGIFEDWFRDTFLVEMAYHRQRFSYDGPAFLILDNCSSHYSSEFDALCTAHRVMPVWLPPHSANQLQMLDLCIFAVTKQLIMRVNKLQKVNLQTDHIVRIPDGYMAAGVPNNMPA